MRQKEYKQLFARLRPKIEEIFVAHAAVPPPMFRDAIARSRGAEPNLVLAIGKDMYDRPAKTNASQATVQEFLDVCSPFRVLIYGILMSWYDISLTTSATVFWSQFEFPCAFWRGLSHYFCTLLSRHWQVLHLGGAPQVP
jgi:hypothetical protein